MKLYQISIVAEFVAQANTPADLRKRILRLLTRSSFTEKGWEIEIKPAGGILRAKNNRV